MLHSRLLRRIASGTGKHFQGLGIVSRDRSLALSNRLRRKVRHLDDAFNLIRHITTVSAQQLEDDIVAELSLPVVRFNHGGFCDGSSEGDVVGALCAQQAHLSQLVRDLQEQISQVGPIHEARAVFEDFRDARANSVCVESIDADLKMDDAVIEFEANDDNKFEEYDDCQKSSSAQCVEDVGLTSSLPADATEDLPPRFALRVDGGKGKGKGWWR